MYCPRCGTQNAHGSSFCISCGASIAQAPPPAYPCTTPYGPHPYGAIDYRRKSEGVALLFAFLLPGAGHIYAGKMVKGIAILLPFFVGTITTFLIWAPVFSSIDNTTDPSFGTMPGTELIVFTAIVAIVLLVIWIYQFIDAYYVIKRFNNELMATGHEPW
jgi:hypothetical protein